MGILNDSPLVLSQTLPTSYVKVRDWSCCDAV